MRKGERLAFFKSFPLFFFFFFWMYFKSLLSTQDKKEREIIFYYFRRRNLVQRFHTALRDEDSSTAVHIDMSAAFRGTTYFRAHKTGPHGSQRLIQYTRHRNNRRILCSSLWITTCRCCEWGNKWCAEAFFFIWYNDMEPSIVPRFRPQWASITQMRYHKHASKWETAIRGGRSPWLCLLIGR